MKRSLVFLIVSALPAMAGEVKVDINRDSKNLDSVTEVGYVKWSPDTTNAAATGTAAITRTFTSSTGETVVVSFAQTAASASLGGTGLLSNWYQTGAQGTAKLVSDGITVAPAALATGGQIAMTITGLAAGPHTLLTFHNAWDALAAGSLGTMDISVNGTTAVTRLQPTIRATTNNLAASAYVEFTTTSAADVTTIVFASRTDTVAPVTIRNVMINGFEIDTPNSVRIANTPAPADGDEHVDADAGTAVLSWLAASLGNGASHDVYLGTDRNAVKAATRTSPEFLGNQTALSRTVPVIGKHASYYWRIDEVDAVGNATKGTVWYFRPRVLAFPGAEGHGRFARGGKGGRVVKVTSLADYAVGDTPIPGTLRYAIEVETGPRFIVFDVSGLITVLSRLSLASPYVTVAGQTAPGKGICLRSWPLGLSGAKDANIRFLRNRPGNISGQTIDGGGLAGCDHSIMDHCSTSWSIDEGFSSRSGKNITLQNSMIAEALNIAGHQNYPAGTAHGYAATISGDKGSFHHNLLAHCEGRNWSLGGGLDAAGFWAGRLDIRNNVVYNWRGRTTDGGAHEVNFVNNYYKPGAASNIFTALNAQYDNFPGTQRYYMAGNVMPGRWTEANQAAGRTASGNVPTAYSPWSDTPFFEHYVTTQSATAAYKRVLSDVGASRPRLDTHDVRVINETRTGTYTYTGTGPYGGYPGLPNSQNDVGGWESYPEEYRPADFDTDNDGLPNWWEQIVGTNPNSTVGDFSDSATDPENDGYTRMDDYVNWLALPQGKTFGTTPIDFDLATLTVGYTTGISRQVALVTAGSGAVSILADGKTARFTPAPGFTGLARFTHTVTDSVGDTMTGEIGVVVAAADSAREPAVEVSKTNTGYRLAFRAEPGKRHRIVHSTDLSTWTEWQQLDASGAVQVFDLPVELNPAPVRFFRTEEQ